MKLLMFHAKSFWFKTFKKTLKEVEKDIREEEIKSAVVVFLQNEKEDKGRMEKIINDAAGNIKWLFGKVKAQSVVLHAFAHLSSSRSSVDFAKEAFEKLEKKLAEEGLKVSTTPFGYFCEFKIHVSGESLGKVFKDI